MKTRTHFSWTLEAKSLHREFESVHGYVTYHIRVEKLTTICVASSCAGFKGVVAKLSMIYLSNGR